MWLLLCCMLLLPVSTASSPTTASTNTSLASIVAFVDGLDAEMGGKIAWMLLRHGVTVQLHSPFSSGNSSSVIILSSRTLLALSTHTESTFRQKETTLAFIHLNLNTSQADLIMMSGDKKESLLLGRPLEEVVFKVIQLLREKRTDQQESSGCENGIPFWLTLLFALLALLLITSLGIICIFNFRRKKAVHEEQLDSERSSKCESLSDVCVAVVSVAGSSSSDQVFTSLKDSAMSEKEFSNHSALPSLHSRPIQNRIDEPVTDSEFEVYMKDAIEFCVEYSRNPMKYPVSTSSKPGFLFKVLPLRAPDLPESFEAVMEDMKHLILPGMVHWQHPRFHAFFPNGRCFPDILAETLISVLGTVGFSWHSNPAMTEMEMTVMNWFGRAIALPESFLFDEKAEGESNGGGTIMDSASIGIFCAVLAARNKKIEEELAKTVMSTEPLSDEKRHYSKKYSLQAEICSKLVAYGSTEAHSSFEKACLLSMVRCRAIRTRDKNDWGLTKEEVEREMQKDMDRGLIPFYLHIALGTTSTASSDDLSELAPLGAKHNVWVHVDAAYSGACWVEPLLRPNTEGLHLVDSINVNLHKMFLVSSTCSAFWTRHQMQYKRAFAVSPVYLKRGAGEQDFRDWGVDLSRRFKALKIWFLLRLYGIQGMRAYINRLCDMTKYMEQLLVTHPNIRQFGKTNYGLFCLRYYEDGLSEEKCSEYTNKLCQFMNESHEIMLTHSAVGKIDVLRVSINYERTTKEDIEESADIFLRLLGEFIKRKDSVDVVETRASAPLPGHQKKRLPLDMDDDVCGSPAISVASTPVNHIRETDAISLVGPSTMDSLSLPAAATSITSMPPINALKSTR